jgi:NADH-quinone oxidoreductase subunit J
MGHPAIFLPLALIAVVSALGMLVSRNPVYSALFLILNFASIAVFYVLLNAPFLAVVQVAVYAGAIMVLFLFVIMLLGADIGEGVFAAKGWQLPLAVTLAVALIGSFIAAILLSDGRGAHSAAVPDSSPTNLAFILFSDYVFLFEVVGVLLLVAVIGLFVMSRKMKK